MNRFQIQRDEAGLAFIAEVPQDALGETFETRREADERLLDGVPRTRMTPEAWEALSYLLEN